MIWGLLFIVPVFANISGALCQEHLSILRGREGGGMEQLIGPVSEWLANSQASRRVTQARLGPTALPDSLAPVALSSGGPTHSTSLGQED